MNLKYLGIILLLHQAIGQKVSIKVYYECLCPDSIVFITNQLYPTYKSNIGKYLDIELVPSFASVSVNFIISNYYIK